MIRATGEHRLFAQDGCAKISDLHAGARLAIARTRCRSRVQPIEWPDRATIALLGHLVGERRALRTAGATARHRKTNSALVRRGVDDAMGTHRHPVHRLRWRCERHPPRQPRCQPRRASRMLSSPSWLGTQSGSLPASARAKPCPRGTISISVTPSPDQATHAPGTTGNGMASPPMILASVSAADSGSFAGTAAW